MTQDLDSLNEGDVVSISDIPEFQAVRITRISRSGVTVQTARGLVILACGSPAVLIRRGAYVPAPPEPKAVIYQELPPNDLSAVLKPAAHA